MLNNPLVTRTACIKAQPEALKLLDFRSARKRIYAKLTPKIQAHYRVTKIGTCFGGRRRFFLICASVFPFREVSSENIIGDAIVPVNIGRTVHGKSVVFGKLLTPRLLIAVNSPIIAIVSAPKNRLSVLIQELLG